MVNFSDYNDDTNDLHKTEEGRTLLNQYLSQNKDDLLIQLIEIRAKLPSDYDLTNLSNIIPKKDQSLTNPEHATSNKHNQENLELNSQKLHLNVPPIHPGKGKQVLTSQFPSDQNQAIIDQIQ
eukprot:Gb_29608 [translate_table: standard]